MKNMLEFTPSRRITVQQAMEHPFFTPLKGTGYFPVYAAQAEAAQRSTASTGIELIADSDFMHNVSSRKLLCLEFLIHSFDRLLKSYLQSISESNWGFHSIS